MASSIQQLVAQMNAAKPANEEERLALSEAARKLQLRSEDGLEITWGLVKSPMVLSVHKIGIDLGIFVKLAKANKSLSIDELAASTNASPIVITRLLRYLASECSVDQVDATHYQANTRTRAVASENFAAGIDHSFQTHARTFLEFPGHLARHNYANPTVPNDTAMGKALGIDGPIFEWGMTQPELTSLFMKFMSVQYRSYESWSSGIDVPGICAGSEASTPLFVDIGGSIGHQCVDFRTRYPEIPGRVILQDQPSIVEHSIPHAGVEKQPTDFWKPQTVKGARIYYMRYILHDYPDEKAIELLKLTKAAMGPESVIAIDDLCIPDVGAHWRAATMDINMMASLSSQERTRSQWEALLPNAGLKIRDIKQYVLDTAASIIIAVPA